MAKINLTHSTTFKNLLLSLSEDGKPSMSSALSVIPNAMTPSEREAFNCHYQKFGEIVFSLKPSILKDPKSRIWTRDSYTRTAPVKTVSQLHDERLQRLTVKLEKYSTLLEIQPLRSVKEGFKSRVEFSMPLVQLTNCLMYDEAFQMSFLEVMGINIELPHKATSNDPLLSALLEQAPKSLKKKGGTSNLSKQDEQCLVDICRNYHQSKLSKATRTFDKNVHRFYLTQSDETLLESMVDKLRDWGEKTNYGQSKEVDITALLTLVRNEAFKHEGDLTHFAFEIAKRLAAEYVYDIDGQLFSSKSEAWEHLADNTEANTQQSLTFSSGEIFALKAERIDAVDVPERLTEIQPLKFSISEAASVNYVDQIQSAYDQLATLLGITSRTSSFTKNTLFEVCLDTGSTINDLVALSQDKRIENDSDKREQLIALHSQVRNALTELSPQQAAYLELDRQYRMVRDTKLNLDFALGVPNMPWDDGRAFYKDALELLSVRTDGELTADEILRIARAHELDGFIDADYNTINFITNTLRDAFENVPNVTPYFEVTKDLAIEDIHQIHVPDSLSQVMETVKKEHPEIASKVTYYIDTQKDGLLSSLEKCHTFISQNELANLVSDIPQSVKASEVEALEYEAKFQMG